jgi:hypothetical protein
MDALSCIGQCFIAQEALEQLPTPSQVGKTKVCGIDFNKGRMRWLAQAVLALSASPPRYGAWFGHTLRKNVLCPAAAPRSLSPLENFRGCLTGLASHIVQPQTTKPCRYPENNSDDLFV